MMITPTALRLAILGGLLSDTIKADHVRGSDQETRYAESSSLSEDSCPPGTTATTTSCCGGDTIQLASSYFQLGLTTGACTQGPCGGRRDLSSSSDIFSSSSDDGLTCTATSAACCPPGQTTQVDSTYLVTSDPPGCTAGDCVVGPYCCSGTQYDGTIGAIYAAQHCSQGSCCGAICRLLSEFDVGEKNRILFELLEGDELEQQLKIFEASKSSRNSLGFCENPGSVYHGLGSVTLEQCFDPKNILPSYLQEAQKHDDEISSKDFVPWISPKKGTLVASNPGIWVFENFLSEDEVNQAFVLAEKYGKEHNMFGPCKKLPNTAHQSEHKLCLHISPTNICKGHDIDPNTCRDGTPENEDADFVSELFSKYKNLFPLDNFIYPYLKIQQTSGGAPPMGLHFDNYPVTFLVYLTDGGASTIFPNANFTITPKKGAAYAWLSQFADGTRNPMAYHAIQAHPKGAKDRLIMSIELRGNFQDIIMSLDS